MQYNKISGGAGKSDFFGNAAMDGNPYKTLPDGTLDFTAYDKMPGALEGGEAMGPLQGVESSEEAAGLGAEAGGGMAAGGAGAAATMNPYLIAGSLALQAYSANQKQQQEYAMRKQAGMEKAAYNGAQAFDRMRNLV